LNFDSTSIIGLVNIEEEVIFYLPGIRMEGTIFDVEGKEV